MEPPFKQLNEGRDSPILNIMLFPERLTLTMIPVITVRVMSALVILLFFMCSAYPEILLVHKFGLHQGALHVSRGNKIFFSPLQASANPLKKSFFKQNEGSVY
jgi:hypothetical protein